MALVMVLSCTANQLEAPFEQNSTIVMDGGSESNTEDSDPPCLTTRLMAGQHHESGIVTLDIQDGHVIITYKMNEEWSIGITHLSVGNCEDDWVPLNGAGNPKIGQFEYTTPYSESSTEVVYISLVLRSWVTPYVLLPMRRLRDQPVKKRPGQKALSLKATDGRCLCKPN
jgi:hypothetical protein